MTPIRARPTGGFLYGIPTEHHQVFSTDIVDGREIRESRTTGNETTGMKP